MDVICLAICIVPFVIQWQIAHTCRLIIICTGCLGQLHCCKQTQHSAFIIQNCIDRISFRHYLPVLKGFPPQYIYEPWNAPESVQKAAKCIVGKDYPVPMVNHAEASKLCMERMKQVYQSLIKRRTRGKQFKYLGYSFKLCYTKYVQLFYLP